jgi:hypothetical protein
MTGDHLDRLLRARGLVTALHAVIAHRTGMIPPFSPVELDWAEDQLCEALRDVVSFSDENDAAAGEQPQRLQEATEREAKARPAQVWTREQEIEAITKGLAYVARRASTEGAP